MSQKIVLASRNKGKIVELAAMLAPHGVEVVSVSEFPDVEDVEETGTTFEENALLKARAVAAATGCVALADDSGIAVDAIGGAPGVYSARYSDGEDWGCATRDLNNNAKLLDALKDVPMEKRTGRFCCVIAAVAPNGAELVRYGAWEGHIAFAAEGDNGFGYDPLFIDSISGKHSATLAPEVKNSRSHRRKALDAVLQDWAAFWEKAQA